MISILNAGSDEVVFSSPRQSNLFNNGKLVRSHSVSYLSDGRVFIDGHPKAYISPVTMWGEVIKRSTSTAKIDEAIKEGAEEEAAEGEHPPVITEEEEDAQTPAELHKHHRLHLWRHRCPVNFGTTIKSHSHRGRSGSA
uniref:FHA domain-containing protein n=1 Tax=Ascaris lumbricoides TaxID=6252 RepID=A0A0M3HPQ1_ASCLU